MSKIQIKAFFRFCRVKVTEQRVDISKKVVMIKVEPDKRYKSVCYKCRGKTED